MDIDIAETKVLIDHFWKTFNISVLSGPRVDQRKFCTTPSIKKDQEQVYMLMFEELKQSEEANISKLNIDDYLMP